MANVDSVPAGKYGKAALEKLGVWDSVADRVVQADNVRAALAFVAKGEAPLGIVYATDANAEKAVKVLGIFPADSHPPILYPVALTAASKNPDAKAFLDFMPSRRGQAGLEEQGFTFVAPATLTGPAMTRPRTRVADVPVARRIAVRRLVAEDGLDLEELVEAALALFAAVAGLLVAAERRRGSGIGVVEVDVAGAQPRRRAARARCSPDDVARRGRRACRWRCATASSSSS